MENNKGPVSQFLEKNFLHFNAATVVDATKGYETNLTVGGKMLVSHAGAMSTAELRTQPLRMVRIQAAFQMKKSLGKIRC